MRARQASEDDLTLGGRLAAAFGSLFFSVPLAGLFWLLFNSQIAAFSDNVIPVSYFGAAVLAFSAITFAFPRFAPTVFGWLCDLFFGIAKWW